MHLSSARGLLSTSRGSRARRSRRNHHECGAPLPVRSTRSQPPEQQALEVQFSFENPPPAVLPPCYRSCATPVRLARRARGVIFPHAPIDFSCLVATYVVNSATM